MAGSERHCPSRRRQRCGSWPGAERITRGNEEARMSVTVADLLNLPSLRQAKVLGGRNGLGKIVSSISVLESVDPGILIDPLFPQGEFYTLLFCFF